MADGVAGNPAAGERILSELGRFRLAVIDRSWRVVLPCGATASVTLIGDTVI
jgi:hypothetical protein